MTTTHDWLALTHENILEPDLPIIDPHHHLWIENPELGRGRYLLDDVLADIAGHNVRQTVFVQCRSMYRTDGPIELRPVGETEFVHAVAEESATGRHGPARIAAGIVGTADLMRGDDVVPVLEAHLAASPRFRGIRHITAWVEPEIRPQPGVTKGMLIDPAFRRGFAHLRDRNLTFDAWLFHPQIPELTDLARAFPDTTIILNHLGGPLGVGHFAGRRDEVFARWRTDIDALAQCPNVVAKIGGIQMPAINGYDWHLRPQPPTSDQLIEANGPWYLHTVEQFGPDRCMFESNFPPDRASCSYTVLWNQFKKLTAGFTPRERAAMFHDTARRVYRLPEV